VGRFALQADCAGLRVSATIGGYLIPCIAANAMVLDNALNHSDDKDKARNGKNQKSSFSSCGFGHTFFTRY
jgi:hypothetical protein